MAMIDGTTLIDPGTAHEYFSPPFPRRGEAATFVIEVSALVGSPTLVVAVQHRNLDDTTWTTADTFSNITSAGVATLDVASLKEMIRLSYTFSAGTQGDFVHIMVPTPAWRLFD